MIKCVSDHAWHWWFWSCRSLLPLFAFLVLFCHLSWTDGNGKLPGLDVAPKLGIGIPDGRRVVLQQRVESQHVVFVESLQIQVTNTVLPKTYRIKKIGLELP